MEGAEPEGGGAKCSGGRHPCPWPVQRADGVRANRSHQRCFDAPVGILQGLCPAGESDAASPRTVRGTLEPP